MPGHFVQSCQLGHLRNYLQDIHELVNTLVGYVQVGSLHACEKGYERVIWLGGQQC